MSSSVFFKFKSQKEPQRVTFDGTGISVFELKRDIITISRLGDGTDFDLAIYSVDTNDEYDDDTAIISRGTTVVARRLPATKPGAGRAARYVSGKMPVTAKNQHRVEASRSNAPTRTTSTMAAPADNSNMTEEEKLAAMFQAGGEQWEQQQQQMATQKAIHKTGGFQKPVNVPDKPLPNGYTCHRCGKKGHWIQACPTNNDPNWEERPKFRKTTGIPRSFLKVVAKAAEVSAGATLDGVPPPPGVMVNIAGDWVVAEPDKKAWEQFQAKAKVSAEQAEAAATGSQELRNLGLECPIDKRLFVDPMKTPCCGKTYCRDCIENALLGNDFVCPGCSSDNVLVDNLVTDDETLEKIKSYEDDKAAQAKKEKEKSATPLPENAVQSPGNEKSQAQASPKPTSAAAQGTVSASTTPQPQSAESKKRAAEEPLENPRIPTGPAAMRNKQNNPQMTSVPQNMDQFVQQMNAMSQGMPPNQQGMNAFMPPGMNMGFNNMMGNMPMNMMGMNNPMMMNGGWGGMGFGMNAMNSGGMGFPQGQGNNMYGGGNGGGFNPMMAQNRGNFGGQWQGNQAWNNGNMNGMAQQQHQNANPDGVNGDEDAYFRKPVNPHRHQARNRRQRSVDYREM